MEVRIKTGHAVQAIQRHIYFFRERAQLIGGQISELALNIPQFIENQREASSPGRLFIPSPENNCQS